jgi:hypothetical protein
MGSFAYPADHGYRYRDVNSHEQFEARVEELLTGTEHVYIKIFKSESHNFRDNLSERLKIYIEYAMGVGGNDTCYVYQDWTPLISSNSFFLKRLKFVLKKSDPKNLTCVIYSVPNVEFDNLTNGSFHIAQINSVRREVQLPHESIFVYKDLLSASVE